MSKSRTFILAVVFFCWGATLPASAASATLTVLFTNNGEPLPDPAHGRVYVYEEGKRERYLAWADASRSIRIEEGVYDVVIRYANDTIVEERVLESFELSGQVTHEESFSIVPASVTPRCSG